MCKMPLSGYEGETAIADHSFDSYDKSHISVYPWDFWVRTFIKSKKFELIGCMIFVNARVPEGHCQNSVEGWFVFRRKA